MEKTHWLVQSALHLIIAGFEELKVAERAAIKECPEKCPEMEDILGYVDLCVRGLSGMSADLKEECERGEK